MKQILPDTKHIIVANTTYVSQGSAATDLRRGGSFKSTFLSRFFLNLTVKKLRKLVHVCRRFAIWRQGVR